MKSNLIASLSLFTCISLGFFSCAENTTGATKGCMNPDAVNYNPDATEDAGGCVIIQQKQYSLFFKFTGTWCQYCGDWGGPAFTSTYDANQGKILALSFQSNSSGTGGDDFSTPAEDTIVSMQSAKYNPSGYPSFGLNDALLSYTQATAQIDANYANQPQAGVGLMYSIGAGMNAGKININAYVKFFQPVTGDYYLAVYVLHKNIVKSQNVLGTYVDDYEHHHVVKSTVTPVFGELVASGATSNGKVIHKAYVFPYDNIPELDITSMEVVAILYKKNGTTYQMVNVTPN